MEFVICSKETHVLKHSNEFKNNLTWRWCWDGGHQFPVFLVNISWIFMLRKERMEHNLPDPPEQLDTRLLNVHLTSLGFGGKVGVVIAMCWAKTSCPFYLFLANRPRPPSPKRRRCFNYVKKEKSFEQHIKTLQT